jgi:sugar phosphate isomerase/epimerase
MMKTLPVAVQLYSVRTEAYADLPGTLRQLKDMGYDYAESAGLYDYSAKDYRQILDDAGVQVISAHVALAEMRADIAKAIADALTLGCRYLAVPYLDEAGRPGTKGFGATLRDIANIGDACKAQGLQLLYHNHDFEFVRMPDGLFGFDHIYARTTPEQLQMEPDTCWIKVAGQDPAAYILKYGGRVPVVHLKDFVKRGEGGQLYELIGMAGKPAAAGEHHFSFKPLGEGQQDIPAILAASLEAGASYVVVEQDLPNDGLSPLQVMARSRAYLRSLGW